MSQYDFYQHAYVTTDWQRAMDEIAKVHGLGGYMSVANAEFSLGSGRTVSAHFSIANKNGIQFEVIQPLSGDCGFYKVDLPETGYSTRFHHLGRHFGDKADFERHRAEGTKRWEVAGTADLMGGGYAYFNARADFGHFIEFFHMPAEYHKDVPNW